MREGHGAEQRSTAPALGPPLAQRRRSPMTRAASAGDRCCVSTNHRAPDAPASCSCTSRTCAGVHPSTSPADRTPASARRSTSDRLTPSASSRCGIRRSTRARRPPRASAHADAADARVGSDHVFDHRTTVRWAGEPRPPRPPSRRARHHDLRRDVGPRGVAPGPSTSVRGSPTSTDPPSVAEAAVDAIRDRTRQPVPARPRRPRAAPRHRRAPATLLRRRPRPGHRRCSSPPVPPRRSPPRCWPSSTPVTR